MDPKLDAENMTSELWSLSLPPLIALGFPDPSYLFTDGISYSFVHSWPITETEKDFKMYEERSENDGAEKVVEQRWSSSLCKTVSSELRNPGECMDCDGLGEVSRPLGK